MMNKTIISLLMALVLLVAGCTFMSSGPGSTNNAIESNEDATDALINVSSGVEDVGSTLDDIDSLLE